MAEKLRARFRRQRGNGALMGARDARLSCAGATAVSSTDGLVDMASIRKGFLFDPAPGQIPEYRPGARSNGDIVSIHCISAGLPVFTLSTEFAGGHASDASGSAVS